MARKRASDADAGRKPAGKQPAPRSRGRRESGAGSSRVWIAAALLAAAAAGLWYFTRDSSAETAAPDAGAPGAPVPLSEAGELDEGPRRTSVSDSRLIDVADDPRTGSASAPVRIVEFADYQCPSCGQFFATTRGALEGFYGERLEWVFVDFPLSSIHDRALPAAVAAECAARQDRFWPYHDLLFENQNRLAERDLRGYAEEAGLDVGRWEACTQGAEARAAVEQDVALGNELGVTGTPTFFIGGERIQGNAPVTAFMEVIDPLVRGAAAPAAPAAPPSPASAPAETEG